jgi:hypothetical protein
MYTHGHGTRDRIREEEEQAVPGRANRGASRSRALSRAGDRSLLGTTGKGRPAHGHVGTHRR